MRPEDLYEGNGAQGPSKATAVNGAFAMAVKKMSESTEAKGRGRGAAVSEALAMAVKKIFSGYKLSLTRIVVQAQRV